MEVVHYTDQNGKDLIDWWFHTLRDQRAVARIAARIERLELGLLGDCKYLREGVNELRIDYGPGYRIYFSRISISGILLLNGGRKSTQKTDIKMARERLKKWLGRQPG